MVVVKNRREIMRIYELMSVLIKSLIMQAYTRNISNTFVSFIIMIKKANAATGSYRYLHKFYIFFDKVDKHMRHYKKKIKYML